MTELSHPKRHADHALANPFSQTFVPKKKVVHMHGRTSLSMYPDTTSDMLDHELSLAFNINKTAVQNALALPHGSKLLIMGEKHNCSNLIDVETAQWKSHAFTQLKDPSNLTLVSYHDHTGTVIIDCFDANGLLKEFADGAAADVRPAGIMFAKVSGTIHFADLDNSAPPVTATFFLRLAMDYRNITLANGQVRNINTFAGPSNWLQLDTAAYHTLVYDHEAGVEAPFDLVPPSFSSPSAVADTDVKVLQISNAVIKASYPTIISQIFNQICPNFINDPFNTLNKVHQETTLPDGSHHKSSVRDYHNMVQTVLTTFPRETNDEWTSNPFRKFVENLSPEIKDKMVSDGFRTHMNAVSHRPHDQIRLIQLGFEAACLAETELAKQRLYIQDTMKEVHGFLTVSSASTPLSNLSSPTHATGSFTSPAEQALSKYSNNKTNTCWGCGSEDHVYYDRRQKKVVCPRGHEKEIIARADSVRKDFVERLKKRRNPTTNKRDHRGSHSLVHNLLSALSSDKKKMLEALLSTDTEPAPKRPKLDPVVFLLTPILMSNNLPPLPIAVNPMLPHIILKLGSHEASFQPGIPVIVDTGASLCCAWTGYIMPICKRYPELVKSITLAKDRYSPIVLSGVVGNKEGKDTGHYSTHLPAVVELHLPYRTEAGAPTSVKFAVGDDVSVNAIIGMTFIKAARLLIDPYDDVVESKLLSVEPFPIDYRLPSKCAPALQPLTDNAESNLTAVISQLDTAQNFINDYQGHHNGIMPTHAPITEPTFEFHPARKTSLTHL